MYTKLARNIYPHTRPVCVPVKGINLNIFKCGCTIYQLFIFKLDAAHIINFTRTKFTILLSGEEKRKRLSDYGTYAIIPCKESQKAEAAYPPSSEGLFSLQTKERGEQPCMLHTLILFSPVSSWSPLLVCVTRSSGVENSRQLLPIVDG